MLYSPMLNSSSRLQSPELLKTYRLTSSFVSLIRCKMPSCQAYVKKRFHPSMISAIFRMARPPSIGL